MITAHSIHKPLALAFGAKDFISKPFDLMEIKMRIRNILEVRLRANPAIQEYAS